MSSGAGSVFNLNAITKGEITVVGRVAKVSIRISINTTGAAPAFTGANEVRIFGGENAFPKSVFRRPRFPVRFANVYGVESHLVIGNYWAELMENGALQLCIIESTAASTAAMTVTNLNTILVWSVANNITNILIDGEYLVKSGNQIL